MAIYYSVVMFLLKEVILKEPLILLLKSNLYNSMCYGSKMQLTACNLKH